MRGADGCAEKHLTFQYATQYSLLIFNIMSCSVGRLQVFICGSDFSAPPILRSRQSDAESSAACVVEGAQRTRGDSAQAFPFVRIVYLREVFPAGFYFTSIKKTARNGQGVLYVMPPKCALGADCRRAWQGRAKMPLVCLAGQVLFFAFSDLYECGSIIFSMCMACFADERNGQASCATVGKTAQKVVRRVLPRASGHAPRAAKANGRSLLQLQGMFF